MPEAAMHEIPPFVPFPKLTRLRRSVVISEKIDGTNAQIMITEEGSILTGSRKRWITPEDDNFGFARWVRENEEELLKLGPGRHYGEWWGSGIQRGYGLPKGEKRFSLFNVLRWHNAGAGPVHIPSPDPRVVKLTTELPTELVKTVPIIGWTGGLDCPDVQYLLDLLMEHGSYAAPGFCRPEGVVAFHLQSSEGFKITLGGDGHKG